MDQQSITMNVAGAIVTIPVETMTKLWLDRVQRLAAEVSTTTVGAAPRIGAYWPEQGGIYAGIARGKPGEPDHHLIVPEPERTSINWMDARKWASELRIDGFGDFTLPTRAEQPVLFGNAPELFVKEAYWSDAEHADNAQFAWCQYFGLGTSTIAHKSAELRARAVRRVPIRLI